MTALRLTYAELAVRLGTSSEAARALARRRGWQRVPGNDGRARVLVEEAQLPERPAARAPVQPPAHDHPRPDAARPPTTPTGDTAQLWARVAELEAARERMAAELLVLVERAARAEGEAGALREALAHARRPWFRLPRRHREG